MVFLFSTAAALFHNLIVTVTLDVVSAGTDRYSSKILTNLGCGEVHILRGTGQGHLLI